MPILLRTEFHFTGELIDMYIQVQQVPIYLLYGSSDTLCMQRTQGQWLQGLPMDLLLISTLLPRTNIFRLIAPYPMSQYFPKSESSGKIGPRRIRPGTQPSMRPHGVDPIAFINKRFISATGKSTTRYWELTKVLTVLKKKNFL
jgi:hypothetical protein